MNEHRFRALIVDDEELARRDLRALLAAEPAVEIIGEADSIPSAAEAIRKLDPDVVFLDIQFPRESGFDLFSCVEIRGKIIFVTAYDQYALRAFEVNALDYLTKPVNPKRLAQALHRLAGEAEISNAELPPLTIEDSILLELNHKYYFVKVGTIVTITATGMYTEVVTAKGLKILSQKTMKEWESRLPHTAFLRVHRSIILNINCVEKIERDIDYSYHAILRGSTGKVPISRRHLSQIRSKML